MSTTTYFVHVKDDEAPESQGKTADAGQTEINGAATVQHTGTFVASINADDSEVSFFVHGDSQAVRLAIAFRHAAHDLMTGVGR